MKVSPWAAAVIIAVWLLLAVLAAVAVISRDIMVHAYLVRGDPGCGSSFAQKSR